jgi:nicotinate phosphoribosyltransferase
MGAVYKLVELNLGGIHRFTSKLSEDKFSFPGSKQIFRETSRDVLARSGECGNGQALIRPVILGGRLIEPLPTLGSVRRRASESLAQLPPALRELEVVEPRPVINSRDLQMLIDQTRMNLARC